MPDQDMIELVQLKAKTVRWDQVYLDPHNPRLADIGEGDEQPMIPDDQIPDAGLQAQLLAALRAGPGIEDLIPRFSKLGFLTIDRVVVRPLHGGEDAYVVLEGNRRMAALRSMQENQRLLLTLSSEVRQSLDEFEVLVYEGGNDQIAWDLQGMRHMGGVKGWGPYQQARFLVAKKQQTNLPPTELAEISGIGRTLVGRLLRSYSGFRQALADEDWGDQITPQDFSIFQEAVFRPIHSTLSQWLGWDDDTERFGREDRLKTLLELMKNTEDGGGPRIARVNPDLRDRFSKLLAPSHEADLHSFINGEMNLETAYLRAVQEETGTDATGPLVDQQIANISKLLEKVGSLPLRRIVKDGRAADFVDLLEELRETVVMQLGVLGFLGNHLDSGQQENSDE